MKTEILAKMKFARWHMAVNVVISATACRLRSTVGNIKKGRGGVLMELKFFQFYFLQLLVNRNTYVVENNGMEKKKYANIISSRIS